MRPSLAVLALVFAAACTPQTPPGARPPGPVASCAPADVQWASAKGTASVDGQAFLKTVGGDVKYGAGNEVDLVPVCAGSTEWVARQVNSGYGAPVDSTLLRVMRTTTSGGDGKFHFGDLPAGDYYVVTTVTWQAPTRYGLEKQGGFLANKVRATEGQVATVIVTK